MKALSGFHIRQRIQSDFAQGSSYSYPVINLHQLNVGVITGLGLIFIAIAPGAFQALIDGIIKNADRLAGRFPRQTFPADEFRPPLWLVPLGVGIIAASFIAYFAR